MQLNSIQKIKTELKRIRNRQNTHKADEKMTRRKIKLRTMLWKLLRAQYSAEPSQKPRRKVKPKEEEEPVRKSKSSGHYT